MDFIPMVAETLGGPSEDFIHMVSVLGKSIAPTKLDSFSSTAQLFHQLAITLWRENTSFWLNRQPHIYPKVDGIIDFSCMPLYLLFFVLPISIVITAFYIVHNLVYYNRNALLQMQ